jgi:hypothetical protein
LDALVFDVDFEHNVAGVYFPKSLNTEFRSEFMIFFGTNYIFANFDCSKVKRNCGHGQIKWTATNDLLQLVWYSMVCMYVCMYVYCQKISLLESILRFFTIVQSIPKHFIFKKTYKSIKVSKVKFSVALLFFKSRYKT